MAAWRQQLDLFALALRRATVLQLPATDAAEADAPTLHASDAHLPGAGWIVGIAAGLAFALLGLLLRSSPWGAAVAALAATTVAVAVTRGSGETALYRTAERLHAPGAAGHSGSGSLVLVLLMAGRFFLLATIASLSAPAVITVLFAAHVVSRLAPLLLARSLDGDLPPRSVQIGAAWCLVPLAVLALVAGLGALAIAVIAATLACYGLWRLARRQAGPADRDLLAAAQPLCEVAFYLGAAIGL